MFLTALAWSCTPVAGQELTLQRDYPGSGPYECPTTAAPVEPTPSQESQAGQLASDAAQAVVLGDLERAEALLEMATEAYEASAELAYQHARVLEEFEGGEAAILEFCRALSLGAESTGFTDARERVDSLYESLRERIPAAAIEAFITGIAQADSSFFTDAIMSFTVSIQEAPEWATPVFNRGVVLERVARIQEGLVDFRRYLEIAPTTVDAILVSERIGLLEGAASVSTPSPGGALVLGVVPGMGQYYTGRPLGGTLVLALAGGAAATGLLRKNIDVICYNEVPPGEPCPPAEIVREITERPLLLPGLAVAAAVTLMGAIEARVKAKRRRAELDAITGERTASRPRLRLPSVTTRGRRVDLNLLRITFR